MILHNIQLWKQFSRKWFCSNIRVKAVFELDCIVKPQHSVQINHLPIGSCSMAWLIASGIPISWIPTSQNNSFYYLKKTPRNSEMEVKGAFNPLEAHRWQINYQYTFAASFVFDSLPISDGWKSNSGTANLSLFIRKIFKKREKHVTIVLQIWKHTCNFIKFGAWLFLWPMQVTGQNEYHSFLTNSQS